MYDPWCHLHAHVFLLLLTFNFHAYYLRSAVDVICVSVTVLATCENRWLLENITDRYRLHALKQKPDQTIRASKSMRVENPENEPICPIIELTGGIGHQIRSWCSNCDRVKPNTWSNCWFPNKSTSEFKMMQRASISNTDRH